MRAEQGDRAEAGCGVGGERSGFREAGGVKWPWVSRKRYEKLAFVARGLALEKEGLVKRMMELDSAR